jgi:hypothetical protein
MKYEPTGLLFTTVSPVPLTMNTTLTLSLHSPAKRDMTITIARSPLNGIDKKIVKLNNKKGNLAIFVFSKQD